MSWIDANQRQPAMDDVVLMTDGESIVLGGYWHGIWLADGPTGVDGYVATHWMVLPDMPVEGA